MFTFTIQIALTGAASGIGLATAKLLASRGAILSITDVNKQGLAPTIKALSGAKHISTVTDVRKSSQVNSWIEKTVQQLGKLDGGVNLAGVVRPPHALADVTDDD
jgi:NAD(P)-dependent dehydrogenase (short-subunit alcohol dehydrogenase family)